MDNGFIEEGWRPQPPPEVGSSRWKDDVAFQVALKLGALKGDANRLLDCGVFDGHDLGFMAVRRAASGWDYFRIERENATV